MTEMLRIVRDIFSAACLCHSLTWFVTWDISYFWEWTAAERVMLLFSVICLTVLQGFGRHFND
jgi:hypothetical protein